MDARSSLIGVTVAMLVISWLAVITRIWVRTWVKALGIDDWLMLTGLVSFSMSALFILMSAYHGIGLLDVNLDPSIAPVGVKWFWAGMVTYPCASSIVKSSICTALLRITSLRRYRIPLYSVIVLSFFGFVIPTLAILLSCRPIAANWDPRQGTCQSPQLLINAGYYYSANCIITDWTCAILPAFILWDVQLKLRIKVSIIVMLAFGVIASIATIGRVATISGYGSTVNYLYHLARIGIWCVLECGMGIAAGSLATFRPLFRFIPFLRSSIAGTHSNARNDPVFHLEEVSRNHAFGDEAHEEAEYMERSDAESQKHILKDTKVYIFKSR
ncbi:hypothetical protein P153DRAFT_346682 [Dothidotthia symphoricarpi CBS 119687]|uniref:Rhodopsin domain-containing protein n=1 Tax=Dothidotthia symphoricarpi CBS 119687 TaxID=1392245 RepID=A0A6A6A7Q1_9PLEO|nr:uncharacterized protein P153DRAFT_346682 [Dothidotthia symphoricarpi CBS 119687]KAF2126681.1 hypothetical protein P153DRAFT_346682 [Dothidotthia symphoricarpi CBS 119687]